MKYIKHSVTIALVLAHFFCSAQVIEYNYPHYLVDGVKQEKSEVKKLLAQKSESNAYLLSSQKHYKNATTAAWIMIIPIGLTSLLLIPEDNSDYAGLGGLIVIGLGLTGAGIVGIIALNENEQGGSHFKKAISAYNGEEGITYREYRPSLDFGLTSGGVGFVYSF